jgi:hypothetical protein
LLANVTAVRRPKKDQENVLKRLARELDGAIASTTAADALLAKSIELRKLVKEFV